MGISITVDLFHHYQKLRDLIGQFAVVDESKDNVVRVNLQWSHVLKESFQNKKEGRFGLRSYYSCFLLIENCKSYPGFSINTFNKS